MSGRVAQLRARVRGAAALHLPLPQPRAFTVARHTRLIVPHATEPTRHFAALRFLPIAARRSPQQTDPSPPPPLLPDAKTVRVGDDCTLEYIDLPPVTTELDDQPTTTPTLVLIHGAPGTYRDFRHLVPLLRQHMPSARIIGINLPGFGRSTVNDTRYFELLNAQRAAQLTLHALYQLVESNARVVLVGHSFGGHTALNIAALNHAALNIAALNHAAAPPHAPLAIVGLVLLASAGTRPHRVLRPRESALVIHALQSAPPLMRRALALALKTFYTTLLKFPSDFPASHFVAGVLRAGTTDFGIIHDHVALLRAARVRSLSAWSSDDEFMEDEIPTALAAALGSDKRLAFCGAGHNLQKTRADVLAREIAAWIRCDESESRVNTNPDVEIRP